MKKETAVAAIIVVAVLTFVGGYMLGNHQGQVTPEGGGDTTAAAGGGRYDSTIVPVGDSPVDGEAGAPITVVLFADMAEESTRRAAEMIQEVREDAQLSDNVRFIVKVLPNRDDENRHAAAAVFYSAEQGQFFGGVYDTLLRHEGALNDAGLRTVIQEAGLSLDGFNEALNEDRYSALIEADINLARSLGITRAPAVVINGRTLSGQDVNSGPIRDAITEEMDITNGLVDRGTNADRVYSRDRKSVV